MKHSVTGPPSARPSPLVGGGGGAVALGHLGGAPAEDSHHVGLAHAGGGVLVGGRVAELVGVHVLAEGGSAALADDLVDAGAGEPAAGSKPERAVAVTGVVGVVGGEAAVGRRVPAPLAEVAL